MPLLPAKNQKTLACIREIQVHRLRTKVYSQKGLTATPLRQTIYTNNYTNNSKLQPHLNLFLELQQRRLQDVPEGKVVTLHVEDVPGDVGNALPVPRLHGLVGHQLQQRHHLVEVVDGFLQVLKCWPVLERLGKFPTSAANNEPSHHMAAGLRSLTQH